MLIIVGLWALGAAVNIALDAWLNGELSILSILFMTVCAPVAPVLLAVALISKCHLLTKPIWRRKC